MGITGICMQLDKKIHSGRRNLCHAFSILGSASTCSRTDNANGNQYYCGAELNTGAGNTQSIDICGKIHNFL